MKLDRHSSEDAPYSGLDVEHEAIIEGNRAKCAQLLRDVGANIITGYGSVTSYVDAYIDYYMGDSHSFSKAEVLMGLQACQQRPPCGFLHEFTRLQHLKSPPPFDYTGPIYPPHSCPLQPNNANCAHSNTLGIMLRAIILMGKEQESLYYLKPFFDLIIQDGIFALGVQMGDDAHIMGRSGLFQQASSGREVLKRVEEMIVLLA